MSMAVHSRLRGDAISLRFRRRTMEAKTISKALRSGRLHGSAAKKAEKRMEAIALDARLLWKIREKMVEISPPGLRGG